MKIYLVTQGEYSDYRVVAAFSTQERAEAIKAALDEPTVAVLEMVLDEIDAPPPGLKLICVYMDREGRSEVCTWGASLENPIGKFIKNYCPRIQVWARDEEHAVKIANEKRMQLIALNQWPE